MQVLSMQIDKTTDSNCIGENVHIAIIYLHFDEFQQNHKW